jgi:hypothetical protein
MRKIGERINSRLAEKAKGAFVSESALHFDGDKPNSVVPRARDAMIIYLAAIARNARLQDRDQRSRLQT